MNKRGKIRKIILVVFGLAVLAAAIYFTFFFAYSCEDLSCFKAHQEKCSRTKFVNDAEDVAWLYHIKGKEDGKCEIEVKVLEVKKGAVDKAGLNEKSMTCYLPFGNTMAPESDLSMCHGILKEELQNLIINKLHAYIVESIGEIGGEFGKVV